ncbi:DUF6368 family protein [Streptomyces sp. AC602_WCS936]|uniref:DUF6368 family protein n=1 Tax=Streptomyces sp. AC602_WCS936 TaxID=2823685 RepID=UPI0035B4DB87
MGSTPRPAEDEDYSAFSRSPVQGLVLGADCSGPANHQVLGHLTLAHRTTRRVDRLRRPAELSHPTR